MSVFVYRTIGSSGNMTEGRIEAQSESQARSLLKNRAEVVLQIREETSAASRRAVRTGKKPSPDEVASTVRQMSILIRAGVPLVEGIRSLAAQVGTQSLGRALERMASDVSQGAPLSEAMAAQSHIFPVLASEMARVAEAGGNLADSMAKLAEHLEKSAEIRRKIRSALAYPMVVVGISVLTVVVLVTCILPRFMKLFSSMGAKIPWTTQMLMSVSHVAVSYWYLFLAGSALAFYLGRNLVRSPGGRRKFHAAALRLPIIGDITSKIVMGRVLASMSTLLSGGVPMVQTLETSASAADNVVVGEALQLAKRQVAEGVATSEALSASGVFPPLVLQMVASGEKTGELPMMLGHVCVMYEKETDAKVKSLTSIIEPVLIVLLGLIVGFVAISVIVPIYSLVGAVR